MLQIQLHLNSETDRFSIKDGQAASELTVTCLANKSLTSASCNTMVPGQQDTKNENLRRHKIV